MSSLLPCVTRSALTMCPRGGSNVGTLHTSVRCLACMPLHPDCRWASVGTFSWGEVRVPFSIMERSCVRQAERQGGREGGSQAGRQRGRKKSLSNHQTSLHSSLFDRLPRRPRPLSHFVPGSWPPPAAAREGDLGPRGVLACRQPTGRQFAATRKPHWMNGPSGRQRGATR